MGKNSAIEWTDHTINFWWGCAKVSPGCKNCYAERMDAHFHPAIPPGQRYQDEKASASHWGHDHPRLIRVRAAGGEALRLQTKAILAGRRQRVFTNSMADFFEGRPSLAVPRAQALLAIQQCPNLDWLVLTKRPELIIRQLVQALSQWRQETGPEAEAMVAWLGRWLGGDPPANVWVGATVEDQERADARVPALLSVPARVRFLSCEPLLGPVDLRLSDCWQGYTPTRGLVHWVIAGGESGPGARPMHPDWARGLRDQCAAAGVPFLFKQWGAWGTRSFLLGSGEPVFRVFRDYEHWAAKAPSWLQKGDIILDAAGRRCRNGGEVRQARPPFTVLCPMGKAAAGRLLDGVLYDAYPEVARG